MFTRMLLDGVCSVI